MRHLTQLINTVSGNALAYALSAIQEAMSYGHGWEDLPQKFIDDVVSFEDSSNLNVCRSALEILLHLCINPTYGFKCLEDTFIRQNQQRNKAPYYNLIQLLVKR